MPRDCPRARPGPNRPPRPRATPGPPRHGRPPATPPAGRARAEPDEAWRNDAEPVERGGELDAPARDERVIGLGERDAGIGTDGLRGPLRPLAVDEHGSREDERLGALARRSEPSANERR